MDKDLHISPEVAVRALRGAILDQESQNPGFIRRLLDDLEDDASMLKLMKDTEKTNNPSVPAENIWSVLNDE